TYNRHSEALADMLNGNIDAMVVEKSWAKEKAKANKKLIIVDDPVQTIKIAAVFPKGNDSLTKEFNKALKTVKENGTYDKIYNKWFAAE
ncbi:MAG: transporter substrate-binding domain-containing protein, partial [Mogibacterium diversum]|nr:transporter substrate-binding domain-containing protein [Mogibacterium diversum]